MAQSKKALAKKIDRVCRQINPQVRAIAARRQRHDLVDAFGLIWGEAHDALRDMQAVHPGMLERTITALQPVTYQYIAHLYERLQQFMQQVPLYR